MSRRTDAVERGGDLGVAFVVDAHEAQLDQASAEGDLGVDDLTRVGEFHGERLLGEDRQAAFEAGHHVAVMEAVRAGDHQRVESSMRSMPSATHSQPSSFASA